VLLACLPDGELERFLEETPLERYTDRTITDPDVLRAAVLETREQGWALVDQELELGLRSVAAPVTGPASCAIAAVNVSAAAQRVSLDEFRERFLPDLIETTAAISAAAGHARARNWRGVEAS
jgi:IclR family pca regulon transcriptional regulator